VPHVELADGPVEYRWIDGSADLAPLVFLHEGLGCAAMWSRFPDQVAAAAGRSALIYSRHGYGGSGQLRGCRPVTYMHHEADQVVPELFAALRIDRPVLVGHSDGASISLLHAAGHPVAGLALLAPHVFVEPETLSGIQAALAAYRDGKLADRLARFHDDPDATFLSWSGIWSSPEFRSWNIEDCLPTVDCPALLIQGMQDQYGTSRQLDVIQKGVTGWTDRVEIEDCGHSPHLDQPEHVADTIVDFVRG
jgi:pimeloyl-ACP methyl ester carboxylesterase